MAAGESAQAEAQRVREKIEALQRYLYAQERGAEGERQTAEALLGLGRDWVVMHDVRWPGRLRANIDHVVVGPTGIYVIDSKNWAGDVRVTKGVLRQNGYSREKNVAGAADGALAIAELVGAAAALVQPVLCFAAQPGMHGFVREVALCSPDNIVAMLSRRPSMLSPQQVFELATRLDGQLRAATEPGRGYRPSDQCVGPPAGRPSRRTSAAPHAIGVSGTSRGMRPSHGPRRAVHLAVALCAVVFIVIPMIGVLIGGLSSAIADLTRPAFECATTAVQEPDTPSGQTPARLGDKRQTAEEQPATTPSASC